MGILTVVSARDLPQKDQGNPSDPYLIVKLDKLKCKTTMIRGNPNLVFNNTFELKGKGSEGQVNFEIWDHDWQSADDLIGTASHYLSDGGFNDQDMVINVNLA